MRKGIEINFYDLFRHVLKKWTILFCFAVLFGVIANAYGYQKRVTAADREKEALEVYAEKLGVDEDDLPDYMTAELTELRGELSDQEAAFVEAVAKLYMYRIWASDKVNAEMIVGEPDQGDLELVKTLYYANEGVESAIIAMTSAEKSYYNVLIKELTDTDMAFVEKDISSPGILQPRWLFIGAALGLMTGVFLIAGRYVLSGKLRVAEDLESPYGLPVLASVEKQGTDLEAVTKGITRLLKENNCSSLAIAGTGTPDAITVINNILAALEAQGVCVSAAEETDNAFIASVANVDAVLFVEQIGKSSYQDIENRISICRKFCVPAVGCIVVR